MTKDFSYQEDKVDEFVNFIQTEVKDNSKDTYYHMIEQYMGTGKTILMAKEMNAIPMDIPGRCIFACSRSDLSVTQAYKSIRDKAFGFKLQERKHEFSRKIKCLILPNGRIVEFASLQTLSHDKYKEKYIENPYEVVQFVLDEAHIGACSYNETKKITKGSTDE